MYFRALQWKGGDLLGQLLEATRDSLIATLGGGSGASLLDTAQAGDPHNDQYIPLSDDDASECFEECLQDELDGLESSPSPLSQDLQQASNSTQGENLQPVTEGEVSGTGVPDAKSQSTTPPAPRGNTRNPFRSQARSDLAIPAQVLEPSSSARSLPQNISTRTSRNRKRNNRSKSQSQISETVPKQLY